MRQCAINSVGSRYNIAGILVWRIYIGTIEGPALPYHEYPKRSLRFRVYTAVVENKGRVSEKQKNPKATPLIPRPIYDMIRTYTEAGGGVILNKINSKSDGKKNVISLLRTDIWSDFHSD